MIAIYTFRGAEYPVYKYKLADGTLVCDSGSTHAIDLKTGYTIWQMVHPYGIIDDPLCVTPVHLFCGYYGVFMQGLFGVKSDFFKYININVQKYIL